MIKSSSVALSILSLALALTACGAGHDVGSTARRTAIAEPIIAVSRELGPIDADDNAILDFGHAATPRQRSELVTMIRRYYVVAAAGEGAKACAMFYSATAREVLTEQDDWGVSGTTCATVMSKIFHRRHRWIVAALNSLKVVRVRTDDLNAFMVLRVAASPLAREFSARHVAGAWKVTKPLDSPMR